MLTEYFIYSHLLFPLFWCSAAQKINSLMKSSSRSADSGRVIVARWCSFLLRSPFGFVISFCNKIRCNKDINFTIYFTIYYFIS
jgi:hypothetical protein